MAAESPLTKLTLGAASVADDIGFVALSDLARALKDRTAEYRVIGGHMVTLLAAKWQLGHELYRETGDVDLGITPIIATDHHVVDRLRALGYAQVAGNRFARGLSDIPVTVTDGDESPLPQAFIDVLVPAYTSRARESVRIGDDLYATEVPGLQLALARPPVTIALDLRRLNAEVLQCELPISDEVSALVLKKPRNHGPVQRHRHNGYLAMSGDRLRRGARTWRLRKGCPGAERRFDPRSLQRAQQSGSRCPRRRTAPLGRGYRRPANPNTGTDRECPRASLTATCPVPARASGEYMS